MPLISQPWIKLNAADKDTSPQNQQNPANIGKVDAADPAQLGDPTGGQCCVALARILGACNVENRRKNCKYNDHDERQLIPAHGGQQLAGTLPRSPLARSVVGRPGLGISRIPPSVNSVPSGSAGCVRSPGIRGSSPSAGHEALTDDTPPSSSNDDLVCMQHGRDALRHTRRWRCRSQP